MYSAKVISFQKINIAAIEQAVQAAGDKIAEEIQREYVEEAQADFNGADPASIKQSSKYRWIIEVKGKKFRYVDNGVAKHKIKAKRKKFLKFPTGYKRKTGKGRIRSRPGGPRGGVAFAKEVTHPGYDGADISGSIDAKYFNGKRAVFFADKELSKVI